jgi:LuxR family transcriptional regulator, quorum-sensing system regulator BjaR1
MAKLDSEVHLFISSLNQIGDIRSFANAFEKMINKFDCRFFVISGIPDGSASLEDLLIVHNLPEGWVNEYLAREYVLSDPIVRHCMESLNPFLWQEALEATISDDAKKVMMRAEAYGLTNGVCFPIHNINGFEAGVSLSGFPRPPKKTEMRSLYLACIMAFNAVRRIRSDHSLRIHPISDREKEVLTWCALGKTSKEIAYILFLSENTVNVHIKNVLGKLSARNKTEAVTIAVRDGIITV